MRFNIDVVLTLEPPSLIDPLFYFIIPFGIISFLTKYFLLLLKTEKKGIPLHMEDFNYCITLKILTIFSVRFFA